MSDFTWPRDNAELVAQLVRQRDRYEQLVRNMSDLLLLIDRNGMVAFSNRQTALPPGDTPFPSVGDRVLDHVVEADRPMVREATEQLWSGQAGSRNLLFHIHDGAGEERVIEATVTPVMEDGQVVQLEVLGRDVTERQRAEDALRQANASLRRRQEDMQRDLDVAAKIHASLLPAPLDTERVLIDLKHVPLLGVGGDYVYIHERDPVRPSLAIFDVSGHGVASALVANRVHSAVYAIMGQGSPPAEMIGRLNRFIYDAFSDLGMFVTLFGMQLDLERQSACYCGAGHPPALLVRRGGGEVVPLESAHLPIGVAPNIFVDEPMRFVDLAPGDVLWLYTDGLMELRDGQGDILGVAGLTERLKRVDVSHPAPGLAARVVQAIVEEFEKPDDDITLLVAAIK